MTAANGAILPARLENKVPNGCLAIRRFRKPDRRWVFKEKSSLSELGRFSSCGLRYGLTSSSLSVAAAAHSESKSERPRIMNFRLIFLNDTCRHTYQAPEPMSKTPSPPFPHKKPGCLVEPTNNRTQSDPTEKPP